MSGLPARVLVYTMSRAGTGLIRRTGRTRPARRTGRAGLSVRREAALLALIHALALAAGSLVLAVVLVDLASLGRVGMTTPIGQTHGGDRHGDRGDHRDQ